MVKAQRINWEVRAWHSTTTPWTPRAEAHCLALPARKHLQSHPPTGPSVSLCSSSPHSLALPNQKNSVSSLIYSTFTEQIPSVPGPGNAEKNKSCTLPLEGEQDKYVNGGSTEDRSWTSRRARFSRKIT